MVTHGSGFKIGGDSNQTRTNQGGTPVVQNVNIQDLIVIILNGFS